MSALVRKLVAVVDDDPRILESLQDLLESAGYDVVVHASGSSLLASGLASIDCLITDIGMPGMDGFELRDRVKRLRPEFPVFLVSGRRDLTDDVAAGQGRDDLFRKPFDGSALLAAVDRAVRGGVGR